METQAASTAEELINETVLSVDESAVLSTLDRKKETMEAEERALVNHYIQEMRPIYAAMFMEDLGGHTAGLYDGSSIYIDRSIAMVGSSVDGAIDQAHEVYKHESYHQEHNHTAPIDVIADTRGDIAAVIGGVEFTETALVEGLTVARTGDQFVSAQYVEFKHDLLRGISQAGIDITDVEQAVNKKKDLTLIDDRKEELVDPSYALVA